MTSPASPSSLDERGSFSPGDRILWAAKNGTVRHGRIIQWDPLPEWTKRTGHWFVEIDHDPKFGRKPNGFKTWFNAADLIKEV